LVDFHTLLFATLGAMQFTGTVGKGTPGDPHSVYLEFDLALRQVILLALSTVMKVKLKPEPAPKAPAGENPATIAKLADTIERSQTASKLDDSHKDQALQLVEWL